MQNAYIPIPVKVDKIITEVDTKDIKTFRFTFVNKEDEENNSASFPFTVRANLRSA